jgi:hypothetical protein
VQFLFGSVRDEALRYSRDARRIATTTPKAAARVGSPCANAPSRNATGSATSVVTPGSERSPRA